MKNRAKYALELAILALLTAGFTACDTTGNTDPVLPDGIPVKGAALILPVGEEQNDYRVSYNGNDFGELGMGNFIIKRGAQSFNVSVYRKSDNELVLSKEVPVAEKDNITIVKVDGQFDLLDEAKYLIFKAKFVASGEDYEVLFNGYEISEYTGWNYGDTENVIKLEDRTGTLEIYKDGVPVFTKEGHTMNPNSMVTILEQYGDFMIFNGGDGGEEAPATPDLTKVRFIFLDGIMGMDMTTMYYPEVVEMKIYTMDMDADISTAELLQTFTFKKGELSPYVEVDMDRYYQGNQWANNTALPFDLIDAESGEVIMDHTIAPMFMCVVDMAIQYINYDMWKPMYKFQTIQLGGLTPSFLFGEGEW